MAIRAEMFVPAEETLAATLTRINPGTDVEIVWFSCDTDVYLVYDDSLDDGDALPASARFRIPANVAWPIEVTGVRILVAAASGTPDASVLGTP